MAKGVSVEQRFDDLIGKLSRVRLNKEHSTNMQDSILRDIEKQLKGLKELYENYSEASSRKT